MCFLFVGLEVDATACPIRLLFLVIESVIGEVMYIARYRVVRLKRAGAFVLFVGFQLLDLGARQTYYLPPLHFLPQKRNYQPISPE